MSDPSPALAWLATDKLRNIHLLKMLAVYPTQARRFDAREGGDHAVLVRLPVAAAGYDREHYPDARWIGVMSAKRADLARAAIERALASPDHVQGRWVFKCMDAVAVEAMHHFSAVTRATAFISFSGAPCTASKPRHAVRRLREPTDAFLACIAHADGYSREEVICFFRTGDGLGYSIGEENSPQAVCMSFALYEDVYEIAALYTCPGLRRQGYARSVVEAACADLRQCNRLLRYQAREDNGPSIDLARTLGLREFLSVEHWLTQGML